MAGKKKDKKDKENIAVGSASSTAYTECQDADVEEEYKSLRAKINDFGSTNISEFSPSNEWQNLFKLFEKLIHEIDEFANKSNPSTEYRKARSNDLYDLVNSYYDMFSTILNKWQITHSKTIEEKMEKTQVMNFTVFSIFMTVLTFLLSNIVVTIKSDFDIKKVVITNLTLLLIVSTLFILIGVFMGLVGKGDRKCVRIFKFILLFLLPIIICVALVLVVLFMKGPENV